MPKKPIECVIMAFNKSVAEELQQRIMKLSKYDTMIPSQYQQALIDFIMTGQGNGVVQAVAGSGKTTTIMQALNELRKTYGSTQKPNIVSSNGFKDVVSYGGINFKSGTTHSICYKAGKSLINFVSFDGKVNRIIWGGKQRKVQGFVLKASNGMQSILKNWVEDAMDMNGIYLEGKAKDKMIYSMSIYIRDLLSRLVGVMKNCGVGLFPHRPMTAQTAQDLFEYYGLTPFLKGDRAVIWNYISIHSNIWDTAIDILQQSNQFYAKNITHPKTQQTMSVPLLWDFDDYFYLCALYDAPMPQYDYLFLDECQDTNTVTQALVKKMIGTRGRAIAVGDVAQAIYAFRGADANAMNQFATDFKATTIPLSLCYRCGVKIIERTNQIYNNKAKIYPYTQIQSLPTAPDGLVFNSPAFNTLTADQVKTLFDGKTGVICRKNAPLMSLVMKLFGYGIAVNFLGRDTLGKSIIGKFKLFQSIFKSGYAYDMNNDSHSYSKSVGTNVKDFQEELSKYRQDQFSAMEKNGAKDKIDTLNDEINGMQTLLGMVEDQFGENGATLENVEQLINQLFSEDALENAVTLTSVHRSKGLEFHRAIILNYTDAFMPDWVGQSHLFEQECNMAYVALTRAERELVFIDLYVDEEEL